MDAVALVCPAGEDFSQEDDLVGPLADGDIEILHAAAGALEVGEFGRDLGDVPLGSLSFMQAQNRYFTGRASFAFATNSPGTEITFIHFDVPDKWLGFCTGHINYFITKQSENPLNGIAVDRTQIGRRCGRDILAKILQNLRNLTSEMFFFNKD